MPYDYSDAQPPRDFELIPNGTIVTVAMHVRAGNVGEDGMLKRSKTGDAEMLDVEFVVVDGEFAKRKFWQNFTLSGSTDGHAKAAEISRSTLRAIIESARGIKPDDMSDQARKARTVRLRDFDNLTFIAKIGVEKGRPKNDGSGDWPDRNTLAAVITPDKKEWKPVEQAPPFDNGTATPFNPTLPISRPGWAV
jgi:hypothetical protein